ncbi:hypothetical protein ABH521_002955 [Staphylococcus warneri]|uniref:hypothetical protein n=1 Tax=Staphylococcus warneri TaxID=1292 RepID=UPI003261963C
MDKNTFSDRVKKQLWFLNKTEKDQLNQELNQLNEHETDALNKPVKFSNQFLRTHIFRQKNISSFSLILLLMGIVFTYVILLGGFLFGLITSLTAVNYFINPQVTLSTVTVILIIVCAILLMIISLFLIKKVTAFFTKKLLEYKFNKQNTNV